jgi:hypothetical protein
MFGKLPKIKNSTIYSGTNEELCEDIVTVQTDVNSISNSRIESPLMVFAGGYKENKTPRSIFKQALAKINKSLYSCNFSEERMLSIFNEAVFTDFLIDPEHQWNFLLARENITLEHGRVSYELPEGHWKPIRLFARKDYCFYETHSEFRRIEPIEEGDNFDYYTYTTIGGLIKIFLPVDVSHCASCGQCSVCKKIFGTLTYDFLHFPRMPESLDDELYWFPQMPEATQYIAELIIEGIHRANGNEAYTSYKKLNLRLSLISTDKSLPVSSKPKRSKKVFTFSNY